MGKQWTADITISETLVQDLLKQKFPQLIPLQLESFGEGWDNLLFLVNRKYIFRFPRRTLAADLIEREIRVLPELSSLLPVPIPKPCFVGQSTDEYPYSFFGYPKIAGTVPYMLKLTDDQRTKSAVRWAELLRALHSIRIGEALQWGIASSDYIGRMDVGKRVKMFITKVEEAQQKGLIENPNALLSIIDDLPTTEFVRQQKYRTLVHGDLNFRNFLVDNEGILSSVIDWGDAHIGHPAVDLSVVYSFLPPNARSDFFKAYGEVDTPTRLLAKFRSLYVNIVILMYAHDIKDSRQLLEAKRALALSIER
jgi:aminoglycoside phosphotransferase (APT) family kinase protein